MDRWVNAAIEQWDQLLLSTLGSTHGVYLLLIFCVMVALSYPIAKILFDSERGFLFILIGSLSPLLLFLMGLSAAELYFVNPHTAVETQEAVRYGTGFLISLFIGCWMTKNLWDLSYTKTLSGIVLIYLASCAALIVGDYAMTAIQISSEVVEPTARQNLP